MTRRLTYACVPVALLVVTLIGCDVLDEVEETLDASRPKSGPNVTDVIQSAARPGSIVLVQVDQPVFGEEEETSIKIGDLFAKIHEIVDAQNARVRVPLLPASTVPVAVLTSEGDGGETGRLKILPARSLNLLMSFEDGRLGLVNASPGADAVRRSRNDGGRRIQYEVFNALGRLLFRGITSHPTDGRHEMFDQSEKDDRYLRVLGGEIANAGLFRIRIPNVPGGAVVRFFDVPDDANVNTPEGLRLREFMTEMQIEG